MTIKISWKRLAGAAGAVLLACLLVACGGSSGGPGGSCVNVDPARAPVLPGCGASTSPGSGTSASNLTMSLVDSSGGTTMNLTPDNGATVKVTLKDNSGIAVPNTVVTFSSSDATGVFSPSSRTAMTDASGNAAVALAAGTQAGAYTITATATVGTSSAKATANYTVSFPTLTLSAIQVTPSTLSAGGNASATVSVLNGSAAYTIPVAVDFTSACIAAGKAVIGTPVTTQNGTAVASYTDKGCGTSDTLTATVTLPNATLTKSTTITVLPATIGSIKYVGVDSSNIALKGTGGTNRPEYATVKFQLFDKNGSPVAGKQVNFAFADSMGTSTTGGLKLNPAIATSAADGTVTTAVSDGTIPTSVRVVATVDGSNPPLTSVSSQLVVSSGVPDQAHFSLSTTTGNCEGWNIDQVCSTVKATVGDHFGNPVPDGTAVSFSVESGVIGASCQTVNGICGVPLYSGQPRREGRLTVLAYALGEEAFTDSNGNNVYDPGEPFSDLQPNIFRDDNENGRWDAGEPCIGVNPPPGCSAAGDGAYNGVLRIPQVKSAQTQYVSAQLIQQFSTSSANITISPSTLSCSGLTSVTAQVTVRDLNGVWMPAGSSIGFSATFNGAFPLATSPLAVTVPNVVLGVGSPLGIPTYAVAVSCPPTVGSTGLFTVTVRTPSGVTTTATAPIN
jgi:protocatechuate 3,4-dioxygenase beta subunit